jgi:homeobox protein cut-like
MSKNVKTILDDWIQFDIKSIQHELDDKVIEIAQQLEEGDASRKRLIEQTKEFRKGLNDEQRKLVAPILKQFQIEVDASSKRNKLMEQVLLKLYKQLIDLPDPGPALENAQRQSKRAEKLQDLEIENKQLKSTLDEYHQEFAQVKNQEVTIKMLKEKIKELEDKSEQQVQQRLGDKEKELQRLFADKEQQYQENQLELVKKLGDAENKCLQLKSQTDKAREDLYEVKQKQDELINAKICEMELLLQDLDKMTERAVNAERFVDQYTKENQNSKETDKILLQSQYQQLDQSTGQDQIKNKLEETNHRVTSLEIELVAKEKEIAQLVDDIQKLHIKSTKSREFYETQRGQLEQKLTENEKRIEELGFQIIPFHINKNKMKLFILLL